MNYTNSNKSELIGNSLYGTSAVCTLLFLDAFCHQNIYGYTLLVNC